MKKQLGPSIPQEGTPIVEEIEVELEQCQRSLEMELLQYHLCFGHTPFWKLRLMAREGVISQRLAKYCHPTCAACMYGKATKRQWRRKTSTNEDKAYLPTKPGEVISVDELKSPTPGFIAQMPGILTTKRYEYVTVYVNHYSGYGFVYLQMTATAEETVQGKRAFERKCESNGIQVRLYHADNGIFKAHRWVNSYQEQG